MCLKQLYMWIKADGNPNIEITLLYVKPGQEEKADAMETIRS